MKWERKNRIEFKKKGILSKEFTPTGFLDGDVNKNWFRISRGMIVYNWEKPIRTIASLGEAYKERQRKRFNIELTVEELMLKIGYLNEQSNQDATEHPDHQEKIKGKKGNIFTRSS